MSKKKKSYKIVWLGKIYGESVVMATSKDEAEKLAKQGKDKNFEKLDIYPNWEIEKIEVM